MNKNIWIVVLIIVIAVAIFAYSGKNQTEEVPVFEQEESVMPENETTTVEDEGEVGATDQTAEIAEVGSYQGYAPEKLALAENGDVVLFFRASWCPTCRALHENIKVNANNIPSTLTVLDVDYDNSQDLKRKYGVTYQHTLVQVDKDGNMLKKWSNSLSLSALVAEVI